MMSNYYVTLFFSVIYQIWSALETEFLQFIKFYIHQPFILPKTKPEVNNFWLS